MAKYRWISQLQRRLRNFFKLVWLTITNRLRKGLRSLRVDSRQAQGSRGFVLPTAALLLLVVSLVIGAMLFRTALRTEQVIGQRQDKVIYSAATPAVERAKAKIEYLFKKDKRLPGGLPDQEDLISMMLNEPRSLIRKVNDPQGKDGDPYTFKDEERLTIKGKSSNAWSFAVDNDGDGAADDLNENGKPDTTIAYSITYRTPLNQEELKNTSDSKLKERAARQEVRAGSLTAQVSKQCEQAKSNAQDSSEEGKGWFKDASRPGAFIKNFQITAVAISDADEPAVTALEMQQERPANRGNKWGAWFRNDIEVYPGVQFRWNGSLLTGGSLFIGKGREADKDELFQGYLVSSPASCLYQAGPDTSDITLADEIRDEKTKRVVYQGQIMSAGLSTNTALGKSFFHLWKDGGNPDTHENEKAKVTLIPGNDSVRDGAIPEDITLDPLKLFTEDITRFRKASVTPDTIRDPAWQESPFAKEARILNQAGIKAYVDDYYRADDRFGPKPSYGAEEEKTLIFNGVRNGDPITNDALIEGITLKTLDTSAGKEQGLDGYWERRAWREGMRVITGQRLELGNQPLSGTTDYLGEQLNIGTANTNNTGREHETLQRRASRDNSAAVQATAVYHYTKKSGEQQFPVAAIASTVHPGTSETLKRSATFNEIQAPFAVKPPYATLFGATFGDNPEEIETDFLSGRGTNGWEFDVEDNFFTNDLIAKATENLGKFSGDPDGAFPPKQDGTIHPYPALTQWGNFSGLRRALGSNGNQSLADQSTRHTAALSMGMLAYNLSYLDSFDYNNPINQVFLDDPDPNNQFDLNALLQRLDNRVCDIGYYPPNTTNTNAARPCTAANDGINDGEVVAYPNEDLNRNGALDLGEDFDGNNSLEPVVPTMVIYAPAQQVATSRNNPIARVAPSPEAYISGLQAIADALPNGDPNRLNVQRAVQLARMLSEKEQVKRDRKFGFRPSIFGPDTAQQTIDYAPTSTVGSYQYLVKYLYNEDFNGDGNLNSATATGNQIVEALVDGAPNLLPGTFTPSNPRTNIVGTAAIPLEDFDGDGNLDKDFNRNGILDISIGTDLNGDGQPTTYYADLNQNGLNDWEKLKGAASAAGDVFIDETINGNSGLIKTTQGGEAIAGAGTGANLTGNWNQIGAGANAPKFALLNEDIDGNGSLSATVQESTLINPVTGLVGWDINRNNTVDAAANELDEDVDGDGNLFRFQHGGVTYSKGVLVNIGCDFSQATGNNFFGFGDPRTNPLYSTPELKRQAEARFIRLATSLCSAQPKYPSLYYLFPVDLHGRQTVTKDLNGDGIPGVPAAAATYVGRYDEQPLTDLSEDLNFNGRLDPGEDRTATGQTGILDGNPITYLSKNGTALDSYAGFSDDYTVFIDTDADKDIAEIALKPKAIADWVLPYQAVGANPPTGCGSDTSRGPNPNCMRFSLIYDGVQDVYRRVALKDTAFYDGREGMTVRAMNFDAQLLTNKQAGQQNGRIGGDIWIARGDVDALEDGGIVYAFREDAVREDAVSRPANGAWSACQTPYQIVNTNCRSDVDLGRDPPVNADNGISPKPVDFFADPDRRPYGFRIVNGADLSRPARAGNRQYGLSFISDNPLYTKGNFNCHSQGGDCSRPIEEFTQTLSNQTTWGVGEFYGRSVADGRFANPKQDNWRYSEFLVDAVTVLSDNFCDGSIEDGWIAVADVSNPPNMKTPLGVLNRGPANNPTPTMQQIYGCQDNPALQVSSFQNQSRPLNATLNSQVWLRENPADLGSPIKISKNGNPLMALDRLPPAPPAPGVASKVWQGTDYNGAYAALSLAKQGGTATDTGPTVVNGVLISGLVPSRANQSYGGLQNFIRYLERWQGRVQMFYGSLIQLNFSTYAASPYDQDAWEPSQTPSPPIGNAGEVAGFYGAPGRSWGYDVALQKTAPGPISERLLAIGNARGEYYQELPAEDPYVTNLRCALPDPEIGQKTGGCS